MKDSMLKLKLLVKTEMTLGKLHARRAVNQATLAGIALLFVFLGLGMLNFAGYQSFVSRFSPAMAALLVAIGDIIIGIVVFSFAARTGRDGDEERMAQEIRDLVYAELNGDVDAVKAEFAKVTHDVSRIRSGFSALTSGKIGGLIGLAPLIELLTRAARKKKQVSDEPEKDLTRSADGQKPGRKK